MGLILDSSVLIAAERGGQTVADLLEQILSANGDQEAAIASVGLVELAHGIYRANTPARRTRREEFVKELLRDVVVYPLTQQTALLAGQIDGEQQANAAYMSPAQRPAPVGFAHVQTSSGGRSPAPASAT